MNEIKVSSSEFQRDVRRYQDLAKERAAAVCEDGRENCVLISTQEYRRLKRRDREVLAIEDFSEADVDAVRRTQPSAASAAFDGEVTSDA